LLFCLRGGGAVAFFWLAGARKNADEEAERSFLCVGTHELKPRKSQGERAENFFINISHTMSFAVSTSSFAGAKVALRKQQNVQKKQSTMVRAAAVSGEVPVRRYRFFFFSRWTYRLKREDEGEKCRREMSLEGASATGSVAHTPFRNVYGCYLDTIPARFDGCVASICPKTLVLRASFTGNHTNRERASREKTIAKKQGREEISDLSCPGNLSLSLMLSD